MKFLWLFTFLTTAVRADDSSSSSSSSSSSTKASGTNLFVDSDSTYYDGYQQSWRYLGWYVKCGSPSDRYSNQHHSHSGDSSASEESINHYCQRYLIWAAYVDENYQGGGIGEYSYYNYTTQTWDESACKVHGNGRCAPMDCHETNTTTWKLMGIFKEASFFGNDAFFEQLFKHEGICVWNNANTYSFMQTARQNYWPSGCTSTGIQIKNTYSSGYGSYLYVDLRPTWNGNMTYGLYSDDICKNEYDLPDMNVDTVTKNLGLLYGSGLQTWNNGLEAFKVCQPCKAYNIKNTYASSSYSGSYSDSSDPNNGYFQCYDDADYTNVNQCMKFRSHAQLEVCTWEDLVTATNQGGILQVKVGDTIFGSERMTKEEYQSLMKSQKDSNLKWSKAQAQTVAMYRMEAEKVEELKPSADQWSSLGATSIAVGAIAILGAVFLVSKQHIDRMFPSKALSEPLLAPSKDFFNNELAKGDGNQAGKVQAAVPFGNDSDDDDDDDALKKAGTIDDNTSVSSLSYVSTSPDPATNQTRAVDTDAISAWYKNVKKIESHESWNVSDVQENGEDVNTKVDIVAPVNEDEDDPETEHNSTPQSEAADPEVQHETKNSQPEHITNTESEVADPDEHETNIFQPEHIDIPENEFAKSKEDETNPIQTQTELDDVNDDGSDVFDGIDATSELPAIDVPDRGHEAHTSTPAEKFSNAVADDVVTKTNEGSDEVSIKSVLFLGDVDEPRQGNASPVEMDVEKADDGEEEVTNEESIVAQEPVEAVGGDAIVEEVFPETKIDADSEEDVDVESEQETARISNVSLAEANEQTETKYPDEMDQYLSMSTSEDVEVVTETYLEASNEVETQGGPTSDIEPIMSVVPVPSDQADEIHDETVDDK